MTLLLHRGGKEIEYSGLRELETPPATQTHIPIPHFRVVDLVKTAAGMYGSEVVTEHHAVAEDGMRYFGLLSLRSPYTGYEDTIGLRNSHDRSFPVGIAFGSRVFICDNLAFSAESVIKRKHTANLKRDLPGVIGELLEPLALQREAQARMFEGYKRTAITNEQADHAVMRMYRWGIINLQRIPDVIGEWEKPSFEGFEEPTAWRLFNAVTYAMNGRVAENPAATARLHKLIDTFCE